jgi:hypothetical protein
MRTDYAVLVACFVGAAGFGAGIVARQLMPASSLGSHPVVDPTDPDIRRLVQLQERIAASLAPLDSVALDTLIPEDSRGINAADQVLDKDTALRILRAAAGTLVRVVDDSIQVRRYGNVAIMTLRETVTARVDTAMTVGRLRMTEIWLKRGGSWRPVASQATLIPQPAA